MSQIDNNDPKRIAILPAAKTALDSTCQLYQWIDRDSEKFTANGCTILFQHNQQYYCFSNAHVLAGLQLRKTFFILRDKLTMTVGGYMYHSMPLSSLDPKDDYLDVAVVKLTNNTAKHLLENGCKFLTLEDVKIVPALSSVDILLLAGHPASKMKIDQKTQSLKFNPFIGRTIPYLRKIKLNQFQGGIHHLIEFPIKSFRETSTGQQMRAPQPQGMSGSGLWLLEQSGPGVYPRPFLIGILAEYHENNAVMISSKIDLFLDLIRQKFDPSIPNDGVQMDIENLCGND